MITVLADSFAIATRAEAWSPALRGEAPVARWRDWLSRWFRL
ncbi:hypothetical protein [Amaricoccus solimangrovi]|nr:hypothetical protein [Amaricoccus solimangrovi]